MMQLSLRGSCERFFTACESVLGVRPPSAPSTVATRGGCSVLWLGPDEWLVVDPSGSAAQCLARLRSSLAGVHSAVVDVSASRELILVSGPHAQAVMCKAATLDFGLGAFPVGTCAQTNLARTQGIIHRRGPQEFALYVRRSFARYLRAWLDDALDDC